MTSVLVVGAGAVGQVFGHCLKAGGAELTFFVREKYRREVQQGFDLYALNRRRSTEPLRLEGFDVVSTPEEVARKRFDQVYLTVASPAVRGQWLPDLVRALGDSTIVSLQPSPDDRQVVLGSGVTAERLVAGLIGFVSYAAPLPGETRFPRPGMAYWFPPLSPSRFSGPRERTDAVLRALTVGGLPARRHRDVPRAVAFPTAILMAYLSALERAGWSLRALARTGQLALGARGAKEAVAIVSRSEGRPPLAARIVSITLLLRVVLWFAQRVTPFPLEGYLQKHFTKVGDQTQFLISNLISQGKQVGLPVTALEQLASGQTPK
jgi:ketopantoate reductase